MPLMQLVMRLNFGVPSLSLGKIEQAVHVG